MKKAKIHQIKESFEAGDNLASKFQSSYLQRLGIQSKEDNIININGIDVQIGKTDRIEYNNIYLVSFFLKQAGEITIDYIYSSEEEVLA